MYLTDIVTIYSKDQNCTSKNMTSLQNITQLLIKLSLNASVIKIKHYSIGRYRTLTPAILSPNEY